QGRPVLTAEAARATGATIALSRNYSAGEPPAGGRKRPAFHRRDAGGSEQCAATGSVAGRFPCRPDAPPRAEEFPVRAASIYRSPKLWSQNLNIHLSYRASSLQRRVRLIGR